MDHDSTPFLPTSDSAQATSGKAVLRRSIVIISIFALGVDALAIRSVSLLAPFIRSALQLDERQIGYLVAALLAGTLMITLPIGSILGRLNVRLIFPVIMVGIGIDTLFIAGQKSFWGLLFTLFILGVLRASIIPLVNRIITEHFGKHQRGRTLGLVYAAVPLGGFIGSLLLPSVADLVDWNTSYRLLGAIALLGAIVFWRLSPKGTPRQSNNQPKARLGSILTPHFIVLSIAYTIFAFSMAGEVFVTLYLVDVTQITAVLAGTFFGLIQLTGIGGRIFWGFLADRYFSTNRWVLLAVTSGLAAISYALLTGISPSSPLLVIILIMVLLGMSVASSWGILSALVGDVVAIDRVAMATSTIFFLTNVTDILGSIAYGNILSLTHSYRTTLSVFLGFALIASLIFSWMALKNRTRSPLKIS